jgi:hypothetical protein
MLTRDQASHIVYYINAVEECRGNHNGVLAKMMQDGYTEKEIDDALKALGKLAGQDCGIL